MLMTTLRGSANHVEGRHSRRAWEGKSPKTARVLASVFSIGVPVTGACWGAATETRPEGRASGCERINGERRVPTDMDSAKRWAEPD
jgi:hypothetical protein